MEFQSNKEREVVRWGGREKLPGLNVSLWTAQALEQLVEMKVVGMKWIC